MKRKRRQDGLALVTVLGILALFLLVAILLLIMTNQNSKNFGNAYQKQRYYNVAEAGIDRGLRDLDSVLPSPGSTGYLDSTPAPPPPTPSGDQTSLPNVPNVPYYYSYLANPNPSPTSVSDPLAGNFGVSSTHQVNLPPYGALIWSHTDTGMRDVAVEAVVARFSESTGTCALCAGNTVTVTGSQNFSPPPTVCGSASNPDKICSDPLSSPSPAPTSVPIVAGGSYVCSGSAAKAAPCAYGDGTSTPNPTLVSQNASATTLSGFLASQGTIDGFANAGNWQLLSTIPGSGVNYIMCPSGGCGYSDLNNGSTVVPPSAGQVTFVNGNVSLSSKKVVNYGGTYIISGCLSISQPGMAGSNLMASTIVLGTDSQCGGNAVAVSGGGNTQPPLWNGGTLYAAMGSMSLAGNGSVRGYNFYGAVIAAGNITVSGNGYFAWESSTIQQALNFGPFSIVSFAQY